MAETPSPPSSAEPSPLSSSAEPSSPSSSSSAEPVPDLPPEAAEEGTRAAARRARAEAKRDTLRAEAVDVHPPTPLERRAYAAVRGAFFGLARLWFRLEVHGAEKLPAHPFVLAPVHRSNVDFLLTAVITPPRMRYMGKASIWSFGPLGRFVSMLGAFPVHRGTADRESLKTCLRVLDQGESLVMFPEGTRRTGVVVEDIFDGPAYVAARAGVPLVPLGIGGTEAAMPPGARFIKPRKVVLVVGDPIYPPAAGGGSRAPRRIVRELTNELHGAVQATFDEARTLSG
ncbi:MAG TPA: lysophospholipid acyltransferase family protein [Acidimicrobiales bacterium]|nr:lysophospholipid acyltransferase family protein [Acidimicrobiales bacterium]